MLFRKDIDPRCAYCQKGTTLNDREVACVKMGVMPAESSCRAFRYDPLRRTPPRPVSLRLPALRQEDFKL